MKLQCRCRLGQNCVDFVDFEGRNSISRNPLDVYNMIWYQNDVRYEIIWYYNWWKIGLEGSYLTSQPCRVKVVGLLTYCFMTGTLWILNVPEGGGDFVEETVAPVWSCTMPGWKPRAFLSQLALMSQAPSQECTRVITQRASHFLTPATPVSIISNDVSVILTDVISTDMV